MCEDLERFPDELPGCGKVVLVTGSSGLIGRRLVPFLRTLGYTVRGLSRTPEGEGNFRWDPSAGFVDPKALEGCHAVIHLAGENIAGGRWTKERRERILQSRIDGTRTLVEGMAACSDPPSVLVSASGINYYKTGSSARSEDSSRGDGFLSEVCEAWESEALKAQTTGIRVVCMRTGIVLDPLGGALGKMLPAFQIGLGGPVGDGTQGFSWIAMDDLLDLYAAALRDPQLEGRVNAVHPQQVSQRQFRKVLGSVLHRPTVFPLPAIVVKALFGQMGEETLLADLTVQPTKLMDLGHNFRFKGLEDALSFMLGKTTS
nr:TIGR01777 family oxidoreductase [Oceanipulchritudo coccoides]